LPDGPRGGLNHLYAYVGNNPVNFTDPEGLCPQSIVTGWRYRTNTLGRGNGRYQVEYANNYSLTLVDQKGTCGECPIANVIYCKYDVQDASYLRRRSYQSSTQQYGNWSEWEGGWHYNALLSGVYYAYDCKTKKFVGNLLF
jgi:hypothetical protein